MYNVRTPSLPIQMFKSKFEKECTTVPESNNLAGHNISGCQTYRSIGTAGRFLKLTAIFLQVEFFLQRFGKKCFGKEEVELMTRHNLSKLNLSSWQVG